jgi:hypothetical protein
VRPESCAALAQRSTTLRKANTLNIRTRVLDCGGTIVTPALAFDASVATLHQLAFARTESCAA